MNRLGFTHLSFQVEDLPAVIQAARAFGVEVMDETVIPPTGAPYAIFLRDPDGQLIEVIQL
jgi:catechol 2,3-dioxygenase-like lactoylglutathione lyase family enzyme